MKMLLGLAWVILGVPGLGALSMALPPMDPVLFASLAIWIAGVVPAFGAIVQ
jgi:hypothetical protein